MEDPQAEVLDVLPVAVMVLDGQCRVVRVNQAARDLLAIDGEVAGSWPGEVLRCVAAFGRTDGCGQSARCLDCVLWQTVQIARQGGETAARREAPLEVVGADGTTHRVFLTSAARADGVLGEASGGVVLVVQDITRLHRLSGLVPICAGCKKVRRPDQGWESVEAFIEASSHALFTHTLCPACAEACYREQGSDDSAGA